MDQQQAISTDDLEALRFLVAEYEKAGYAVQSLQRHIAIKYGLTGADTLDLVNGGAIARAQAPLELERKPENKT